MIKVLWVDDEDIQSFDENAYEAGIELDHKTNLEDAKKALKSNFNDYSAIILDAFCLLGRDSKTLENRFLTSAIGDLREIFATKQQPLPWYVYTAGTMEGLDTRLVEINDPRLEFEKQWGKLCYSKTVSKDRSELFDNIIKATKGQPKNKVVYRHNELFELIGEGKFVDSEDARRCMIKMLVALYYPEEVANFDYETNPVRRVLEALFMRLNDCGLIPDACVRQQFNMLDACRYMSGLETQHTNPRLKIRNGYGPILDKNRGKMLQLLLDYGAKGGHVLHGFRVTEEQREEFFGMVLILADMIKWFYRYIEEHSYEDMMYMQNAARRDYQDYISNRVANYYEGKEWGPEEDEDGIWHCGECGFIPNDWDGGMIRINRITTNKSANHYPYFVADYTNL